MSLKKKGVPKDFTISRGLTFNNETYVPLKEVVRMLDFYREYKGSSIGKMLSLHKLGKMRIRKKESLLSRLFK